ncbi:Gfo/Idh/MocA family protein [Paenibacillus chitinolyticus]|uniref:Gfo/Idh/MocA family protein n=1 Tax=Paenibacillus chitinolyticus TaxID=79263 RepID=UPI003672A518
MRSDKIGVGIIGASGWGKTAHIPALQALSEFEIIAVCTTRQKSAEEIAQSFGINHFYTNPYDLVANPDVDLVVITVKVPDHNELVRATLNAGKHVYCEWPLALNTAEASDIFRLATAKGVRHITGLQARANPAINYVKDLLSEDYLGKVLSINVSYSMPGFPTKGSTIDQAHAYLLDKKNGADQLTITTGHLLDGITYLMGSPFTKISASLETQYKEISVMETGEVIQANAPDYVAINGVLKSGALLSGQIRNSKIAGLSIEIVGTQGEISMKSKDGLMFQWDAFNLQAVIGENQAFQSLSVPSHYYHINPQEVNLISYNIAQLYTQFANDLRKNTYTTPDFQTGCRLHYLLDQIIQSAETGTVQYLTIEE